MGCWSSGQEVVTADITSDISCINTSQPQSCPELKNNIRTTVKFSRYVQPIDKTVVDTLLALAGKSCCSNNVDTGLIPRSDLEQ